ncbi:MAG: hypothetical protein HY646_11360 [Acidobacteria bacterium]|nr:hypothetical protein [Acidobacteriota bacterium]
MEFVFTGVLPATSQSLSMDKWSGARTSVRIAMHRSGNLDAIIPLLAGAQILASCGKIHDILFLN